MEPPDSAPLLAAYWGPRRRTALANLDELLALVMGIRRVWPELRSPEVVLAGAEPVDVSEHVDLKDVLAGFKLADDDYVDAHGNFVGLRPDSSLHTGMLMHAWFAADDAGNRLTVTCCLGGWSEFLSNSVRIDFPHVMVLDTAGMARFRYILEWVVNIFDPDVATLSDRGHWRACLDPETLNYAGYLTFLKTRLSPFATFGLKTERLGAGTLIVLEHHGPAPNAATLRQTQAVMKLRAKAGLV